MLTSTASSGISVSSTGNVYTNLVKHGAAPSEEKAHKFDSVHLSAASEGESAFQKELVSRISQEVRTATTTGDIQRYRSEVMAGTYRPDCMAIASRMLLLVEE